MVILEIVIAVLALALGIVAMGGLYFGLLGCLGVFFHCRPLPGLRTPLHHIEIGAGGFVPLMQSPSPAPSALRPAPSQRAPRHARLTWSSPPLRPDQPSARISCKTAAPECSRSFVAVTRTVGFCTAWTRMISSASWVAPLVSSLR